MRLLRNLISVLAGIVSLAAALLLVPATWLQDNIVDRGGFLAVTRPIADTPQTRQELTGPAVDEIHSLVDIPEFLKGQVDALIAKGVKTVTCTREYQQIWDQTMRDLHESMVQGGRVEVKPDLMPAYDSIVGPIEDVLPVPVPRPATLQPTIASFDAGWMQWILLLTENRAALGAIALVGLALMLLTATHRGASLIMYGIFAAVFTALMWFTVTNLPALVPNVIDRAPFVGQIVTAFEEKAIKDLPHGVSLGIALAAVSALIGIVLMAMRAARDHRNRTGTGRGPTSSGSGARGQSWPGPAAGHAAAPAPVGRPGSAGGGGGGSYAPDGGSYAPGR